MPSRVLLSIFALACALPWRAACAQAPAAAAAEDKASRSQRALRAIEEYEELRVQSKETARQKRALTWLGEIDDPAITEFLQRELTKAGDSAAAAPILEAIAKVPRPELQQELWNALHGESANDAVRLAAATAIASLGERGIDRLMEIVHGPEGSTTAKARDSALTALIATKSDRALRTLAPMLLEGSMADRLKLLRRLDAVHGVFPIDAARIRLVTEATVDVAALAWRQLADGKHERARSLAIDMLERIVDDQRPATGVAADLVRGIVLVRDPDLYPVLLRFGSAGGEVMRRALRAAAPAVANDRALVDFLIAKGLESDKPASREVAKLLLSEAPAEAMAPLLTKVRAELRSGRKKSLELAISLHALLAKDPAWRSDLLNLANSPEPDVKVVGLALLLEIGADNAIPVAQKCLSNRAWELRSVAYRYLTKCRETSSIPLLIARVDHEEGRLAAELNDALFAHTGTRRLTEKEWLQWWESHKVGFALPRAETVRAATGSSSGNTIAYHGIPVVSHRASFLIDVSGSMLQKIGTDKRRTRLDEAKEQLTKVVSALTDVHRVNLIWFSGDVNTVWDKLRKANEANRQELLDAAAKAVSKGGTNIFDALELAFKDNEVDTIYLLTDGEPTTGRLVNADDIVDEVRHWNRERQIVIHAISVGTESDLLRRLAQDSGGVYKCVR